MASRVVFVVELNSNSVEARRLEDFNVSHTVRDLKMEIAKLVGQPTEWRSIAPFFVGQELSDETLALASYNVQNGDTVYFVRNIAASPVLQSPPNYQEVVSANTTPAPDTDGANTVISTLFFKTIQGRTLALAQVPISLTVKELMTRLVEEKNLDDPKFLRLIYGGKQLMPANKLSDYNLGNDSTIDIVYRLPGGVV